MKLVQFIEPGDGMHVGVVEGDEVLDLTSGEGAPRTVHEIYYDGGGDEKGLVRDEKGDPITERYSTVVPILVSETLDLDTEDLGLLEEPVGG